MAMVSPATGGSLAQAPPAARLPTFADRSFGTLISKLGGSPIFAGIALLSTQSARGRMLFHRASRKAPARVSKIPVEQSAQYSTHSFGKVEATVEKARGLVKMGEDHLPDQRKVLQSLVDELSAGIRVMLLGEFSAGKSTLINALVGKEQCETGTQPTTMRFQETLGPNGIRFVDTMGINAAGFEDHKSQTLDHVKHADVVFLVQKAMQPFTVHEVELCEEISKLKPDLAIVVTYWDTLRKEKDQQDCKARIDSCIQKYLRYAERVPVFCVDALAAEEKETDYRGEQDFKSLVSFIEGKLGRASFQILAKCHTALSTFCSMLRQRQVVLNGNWDKKENDINDLKKQQTSDFEKRRQALNDSIFSFEQAIWDSKGEYEEKLERLRRKFGKEIVNDVVEKGNGVDSSYTQRASLILAAMGATTGTPAGAFFGGLFGAAIGRAYSEMEERIEEVKSGAKLEIADLEENLAKKRTDLRSLETGHRRNMEKYREQLQREGANVKKHIHSLQVQVDVVSEEIRKLDCLKKGEGAQ